MDESIYASAKSNRERRNNLEQRRQAAVRAMDFIKAHLRIEIHGVSEQMGIAGWQFPVRNDDLLVALDYLADKLKRQVLDLDQEFNRL